ncbi:MAG: Hsp20/alpha crystallin family protein [Burkholderiales bacterium]
MTGLARYHPFDETFDDLFRGFFVRPLALETQPPVSIRMDVKEDDGAYLVQAEMPGFDKDDIQVAIDGNQVSISAESKRIREEKQGAKILRAERRVGKYSRAFALAQDVDETSAQAKYSDGVLELRLPKKAASASKKLLIQ